MSYALRDIPLAAASDPVPVPPVPARHRAPLTKLQIAVLQHIKEHGPCVLTHGTRTMQRSLSGDLVSMKSDGYHTIITSGMVAAAKGNYGPAYMRLTPYGEACLERGYRDNRFARPYLEVMAHWHAHRDAS